ncbi:MAG: chemotaxis protein CheX [Bdellovibrionales bacterium]|nr:chemotaxis protein CheX [Bdellovibrionales bacterium]
MKIIEEHTALAAHYAVAALSDMCGASFRAAAPIDVLPAFEATQDMYVSLLFTGTVYGEYILALDYPVAMMLSERVCGVAPEQREQSAEVVAELLNTIAGASLSDLGAAHRKLSLLTPRTHFGHALYPNIPTGTTLLRDDQGHEIRLYFILDLMKLDLTVSYDEAVADLKASNSALAQANQALKEQQARLVQAEKMVSVGMLASGVAHEINNPVQYIQYNLEALEGYQNVIQSLLGVYRSIEDSVTRRDATGIEQKMVEAKRVEDENDVSFLLQDTEQLIAESQEGISRIREIVSALSSFARPAGLELEPADINEGIRNTLRLFSAKLGSNCSLEVELGDIPEVFCNVSELNQVFLNLLINAQHAIDDHGTIRILTMTEEGSVVVRISDTGCGIPAEDLPKIFLPFFTTKPVGKGTGLGMYISYEIIERHHGIIEIDSTVGEGTVVSVRLPIRQSGALG